MAPLRSAGTISVTYAMLDATLNATPTPTTNCPASKPLSDRALAVINVPHK